MMTEDVIRLNAASNGRLIVAMLFAINLMGGSQWMAFAAVMIVMVAWLSDALLSAGKVAWAGLIAMIVLISTAILAVATCFAL